MATSSRRGAFVRYDGSSIHCALVGSELKLRDDHPVLYTISVAVFAALLAFGVMFALDGYSVSILTTASACGLGVGAGTFLQVRRAGKAFLPRLSLERRIQVRRVVADGGPVDDPELAQDVLRHSRFILSLPHHPVALGALMGLFAVFGALILINGVQDADASEAAGGGFVVVVGLLGLCVGLPRIARVRRRAADAAEQAAAQLRR